MIAQTQTQNPAFSNVVGIVRDNDIQKCFGVLSDASGLIYELSKVFLSQYRLELFTVRFGKKSQFKSPVMITSLSIAIARLRQLSNIGMKSLTA